MISIKDLLQIFFKDCLQKDLLQIYILQRFNYIIEINNINLLQKLKEQGAAWSIKTCSIFYSETDLSEILYKKSAQHSSINVVLHMLQHLVQHLG